MEDKYRQFFGEMICLIGQVMPITMGEKGIEEVMAFITKCVEREVNHMLQEGEEDE
ncbi:MAG: hypothetical protein ACXADY_26315 [Candidatus Hodarchaeales archaeon]|jgi:hypothetical protein